MKKLLLAILLLQTFNSFSQRDIDLVRLTFDNYKAAIIATNGVQAVKLVDNKTISYYARMLDHVRMSDSTVVKKLPILDRLMIFVIRHRTPREKIIGFDAKTLLSYAVDNGMIGKNSVMNSSLGEVTVTEDAASAPLLVNDVNLGLSFGFRKEEGIWKIDLTSIFGPTEAGFKAMVEGSEIDENEYIFSLLELMTGTSPTTQIWEPVK